MPTAEMPLPLAPTPGYLVWRLSMKWKAAVDRALAPVGVTHAQYSLLASLSGLHRSGTRPTQRQLADHTGLEPLYVSRLARALESAGLVERVAHPRDTRAVELSLTADGLDVAARAVTIVAALLEQLTEPLGGTSSPRTRNLLRDLDALLAHPSPV